MKPFDIDDKDLGMICLTLISVGLVIVMGIGAVPTSVGVPVVTGAVGIIGGAMKGKTNVILRKE